MNRDNSQTRSFCWSSSLLQRPKEKEFEHIGAGFQRVATQSSDFIINPDWVSEGMNHPPPFSGRRYRPWAYEFQGARLWPYGTVENRVAEEQQRRQVIQSAPVQTALEPRAVYGEERSLLSAPIRLVALPSRTPWRSYSLPGCPAKEERDRVDSNVQPNMDNRGIGHEHNGFGTDRTQTYSLTMNAPANRSRYTGDSMYVNNSSDNTSAYSRYAQYDDENRQYGGKFPIVLPEQPRSRYMNFANCEWIR